MSNQDFTQILQGIMQRAGIYSFKTLSDTAGVSRWQILCLRQGKLKQMRVEVLMKLSKTLQISIYELIASFSIEHDDFEVMNVAMKTENSSKNQDLSREIHDLKREYERTVLMMEQQREVLQQEFQISSLEILESLLLFWPTVSQKAKENPQLEAVKILPVVQKPLEKLLQVWGVEAIASVGAEVVYDPQWHELLQGTAQVGEAVKVCYVGYRKGDKLLYRAKVNPLQ